MSLGFITFPSELLSCVPIAILYGFTIEQTVLSFGRLLDVLYEWWHYNWRRTIRVSSDESFMVFMDNLSRRESTTTDVAMVDDMDRI